MRRVFCLIVLFAYVYGYGWEDKCSGCTQGWAQEGNSDIVHVRSLEPIISRVLYEAEADGLCLKSLNVDIKYRMTHDININNWYESCDFKTILYHQRKGEVLPEDICDNGSDNCPIPTDNQIIELLGQWTPVVKSYKIVNSDEFVWYVGPHMEPFSYSLDQDNYRSEICIKNGEKVVILFDIVCDLGLSVDPCIEALIDWNYKVSNDCCCDDW